MPYINNYFSKLIHNIRVRTVSTYSIALISDSRGRVHIGLSILTSIIVLIIVCTCAVSLSVSLSLFPDSKHSILRKPENDIK